MGKLKAADFMQVIGAVRFADDLYADPIRGGAAEAESCAMATGSFVSPASTTPQTQAIPVSLGGLTPKAVKVWTTQQSTVGVTTKQLFGIGFATSPTNRAAVCTNEDAALTNDADRAHDNTALIITYQGVEFGQSTVVEKGDLDSFAADEFTIDWETTSATAIRYHYAVIAGGDVEANIVQFVNPLVDQTSQNINHGLAGAPTCWFGISSHATNVGPGSEGNGISSLSIFASDFTAERWTGIYGDESSPSRAQEAKALGHAAPGFRAEEATITAVDATKITLLWTLQGAQAEHYYGLFLRGVSAKVGTFKSPVGPTPASKVIATGIEPKLFVPWGFQDTEVVGTQDDAQLTFGASDGSNNESGGVMVDDTTGNADRFDSSTKCLAVYDHTQSLQEDASATISGEDVTVEFSNAVAAENEFNYLALGCISARHYGRNFSGSTSDYLTGSGGSIFDVSDVSETPFTVEGFVRIASAGARGIFSIGTADFNSFQLQATAGLKLQAVADTDGLSNWEILNVSTAGMSLDTVHHVAITRDAAGLYTFYVDGVAGGSFTNASDIFVTNQTVKIGAHYSLINDASMWDGDIFEMAFHQSALSAGQLLTIATTGVRPTPAALWYMDDGTLVSDQIASVDLTVNGTTEVQLSQPPWET